MRVNDYQDQDKAFTSKDSPSSSLYLNNRTINQETTGFDEMFLFQDDKKI